MVLPKKCSLEAHKRYHSMKVPHTCPECGDSFSEFQEFLSEHMQTHITEIKRNATFCYKCTECSENNEAVFSSKDYLITHMRENHRTKTWPLRCSACNEKKATSTSVPVQKPTPPPENSTCEICRLEFDSESKLVEHNKTEHSSFPCHLCGLTYDSQQKLDRHCQATHVGDKPGYICYPCKQKGIKRHFNTAVFLEKHLIFKHRIAKQRVQRFVNIGRENRRKDATKRQLASDTEADAEQETLPVKRLRKEGSGLYACVKCSFSTEDSVEFCKHIESHKTVEANQCPECGLCFSVLPSLKKHLFMVHKIRNADEYIKEKGIKEPEELPPDSEDEELDVAVSPRKNIIKDIVPIETQRAKEGPVGELECRVCYKEFENLNLLKNHMRVHGMAFIRSRRAPVNEVKVENESP
ncbi:hypothetical protein LOTGIDRAFT_186390 [Lottia gigantea]|uniref:C2H2-type domain-containing protein n=1 Tax=Lottia gigantea TaxID=225164 RepID=V4CF67_LOTGI|nr:hypothetical protein LOTGIDRAFT_186390 [Lottia gigantea]ESP00650.1 hypothetical protein LOTGIDRAFT_186390 [Lottia gigantea]